NAPHRATPSAETAPPASADVPAASAETSPETQAFVAIPDPEPAAPYADPAPRAARGVYMGTTFHTRTGWFARGNVGASYLHIFRSAASSQVPGTEAFTGSSSVDTVLTEAELSLGGSFARDIGFGFVARISDAGSASLSTKDESLDLRGGLSV